MQEHPTFKAYTDIYEVDIDWTNINIMLAADMSKDKNIENEFLKRNR